MAGMSPHFEFQLRNGVGIDISALPAQMGVAYHENGDLSLVKMSLLQLLLPLIRFRFGVIDLEPITEEELRYLERDDDDDN